MNTTKFVTTQFTGASTISQGFLTHNEPQQSQLSVRKAESPKI